MRKPETRNQKPETRNQKPERAGRTGLLRNTVPVSGFRFLVSGFRFLVSGFWFLLLSAPAATACPVCFGDPSSSLNKGASNGILFMLAIIGLVQIGFIALFWSFWKRAKALRARREQFQLIDGGMQ